MPDIQQFRLPDAGEGLTEAEIVTWRVKPGDTVNDQRPDRRDRDGQVRWSSCPSPFAGVVTELLVPEGVTVDVGTPIIAVDTAPGSGPARTPAARRRRARQPRRPGRRREATRPGAAARPRRAPSSRA